MAEPTESHFSSADRFDCPRCGTHMLLFGTERDGDKSRLLSFECAKCQHVEVVRVPFN